MLHGTPPGAQGQRGVVVQAHGINANMTEGGMFVRLADRLAEADFNVLRFSFRGHGSSDGTQRGMTIAGEMLDLQAAVEYMADRFPRPLSIVASSRDNAVSYEIARQAAAAKPNTEFHTVRGSDHGFDTRQREDEAVTVTADWLIDGDGNRA